MMAGQAGWYRAPGEEGLLRYWNGTAWTEHRQPVPEAVPTPVADAEPAAEAAVEPTPPPAAEAAVEPAPTPIADSIARSVPSAPAAPSSTWDPPDLSTEPDWSMDQFEKQFEKQAASDAGEPGPSYAPNFTQGFDSPFDTPSPEPSSLGSPSLDSRTFGASDDFASMFSTPQSSPGISAELAAAPAPTPVQNSTAIPMPAASSAPPQVAEPAEAGAQLADPEAATPAEPLAEPVPSVDPAASVSRFAPEAPLSAALRYAPPPAAETVIPSPEDRATFAAAKASVPDEPPAPNPKRKRLVSALSAMVLGFAIILIGAALVFFMGQQPVAAAGQVQTLGIITSLGASNGQCTPTARFAAGSGSYSATTGTAVAPCPFQLGQSVSVDYTPANPDASGRIVTPNLIQEYLWVVSVIGLALVLVSLLVFVFSAGSLAAGIAILREGGSDRAGRARKSGGGTRRRSGEPADASR